MFSMRSPVRFRALFAMLVAVLLSAGVPAQVDPDPNSPTPILLTGIGSDRALAMPASNSAAETRQVPLRSFAPGQKVVLFVTNISLLEDEGASAFRLHVRGPGGRIYRYPVVDILKLGSPEPLYAVTVELRDILGFWEGPVERGDLMATLTWRGLASNEVRLSIGNDAVLGKKAVDLRAALAASTKGGAPRGAVSPDLVGYRWSGDRIRFLEQSGFGMTTAVDSRLRRIGLRTYLAEQFELPYPSLANPYPNIPLKPNNAPADCDGEQTTVPDVPPTCFRDTYTMYPVQAWFFKEAFYGDAQLRHRVAWALSQIWVISGVDTQQSRHMIEYHKILSKNAFGNYRTLMKEMTLNPGMGNYLDMARSTRNNPNENYARELKQLFTIGLFMLNQDGTLILDGNNEPIPTYDQNTVNNFTKVLTGWTFCNNGCPNSAPGVVNYIDPLVLVNNNHDLTAKTLLSYTGSTTTNIPACTGCTGTAIATYANNSLEQTLDNIFYHPNVPPFVSKLLIQHLVTSDPTPAFVGRISAVFRDNGSGVRGDLKSVVRAILLDPEARGDVKTDPDFGKLREPVQFATNFLRTWNVRSADGTGQSDGVIFTRGEFLNMGQNPFNSPTVFNYYPPDYVIPGTALLGPEFALMTTGTSISRANNGNTMTFARINVQNPNIPSGTSIDLSELQALAAADPSCNQLLDVLNQRMMHNAMSPEMRSTIITATLAVSAANPLARAQQALYLVFTSSQYQVQR